MQNAIELGEYFHAHARAAYRNSGADKYLDDAKYILARIQQQNKEEISRRELFHLCQRRFRNVKEMLPLISTLIDMGYLEEQVTPAPESGGWASVSYKVIATSVG